MIVIGKTGRCESKLEKETQHRETKGNETSYFTQPPPPRNALIPRKRPKHAARACLQSHRRSARAYQDERRHRGATRLRTDGALKDGHEGEGRVFLECSVDVAAAEENSENHAEAERAVDEDAGYYCARDLDGCVADFFGHLGCLSE